MRGYSQPVTKNFVALEQVWLHTRKTIEDLVKDFNYTQVGSLYLLESLGDFTDFMEGMDNWATSGNHPDGAYRVRQNESLLDLGKELHFGVAGLDSDILVLREVKPASIPWCVNHYGNGLSGYLVTQNKLSDTTSSSLDRNVKCVIARV